MKSKAHEWQKHSNTNFISTAKKQKVEHFVLFQCQRSFSANASLYVEDEAFKMTFSSANSEK